MAVARWKKRLLAVAAGLFVGFVVAEVVLRTVGWYRGIDYRIYLEELTRPDRLPKQLWRREPGLHVTLAPGARVVATTYDFVVSYQINSLGHRDQEHRLQKTPGRTRVLVLGDSYTFGEGVPYGERFADIPEDNSWEILNGAVPGWGLDQQLLYFARYGRQFDPDFLVLFLNKEVTQRVHTRLVQNKKVVFPSGGQTTSLPRSEGSTLYIPANHKLYTQRPRWLLRHSQFLSYLRYQLHLHSLKATARETFAEHGSWSLKDSEGPQPETDQGRRERTELLLRSFLELCQQERIALIVVSIDPTLNLDYVAHVSSELHYFSFSQQLTEMARETPLRFTYDPHFNSKTHALIGKLFAEVLEKVRVARH